MAKRKRTADSSSGPSNPAKRLQKESAKNRITHALLSHYYTEISTLRTYLLAKLPASSRIRRKKIASLGINVPGAETTCSEQEIELGKALDTTLVTWRRDPPAEVEPTPDFRWEQWLGFSQKGDESYVTLSDGLKGSIYSQSEIVDFVIWLLFSREKPTSWPKHLLCDGFRRTIGHQADSRQAKNAIPGLYVAHANQHVQALKTEPWPQLLMLLGKAGERIMIDLLVDCAIFEPIQAGKDNLYQLSGIPVSELEFIQTEAPKEAKSELKGEQQAVEVSPSEIIFVRNRMFYARAALNARGLVHFGLRHIHVLNRYPYNPSKPRAEGVGNGENRDENVVRVMMYMFPRQFGLHNVFTSTVDRQQTAQKFQDYTLREEEISKKFPKKDGKSLTVHVPKRLRGPPKDLVRKLQILHGRCAYAEMLQHYCPPPGHTEPERTQRPQRCLTASGKASGKAKKPRKSDVAVPEYKHNSIVELSTPISSVSAFCQAVISKIIPNEFWGQGLVQEHNKKCFLKNVHHFIHLRRFESMCLHEALQGMKIADIEWLTPPRLNGQKCSQSDLRKRVEIFSEFIYYVFDSLVIPLLRSNFYVTESSAHKYRLFFFRHDVWRHVAEPAMASLKVKMFEEVPLQTARRILTSRRLGFAQIRLLPKQAAMRPITNLRRRTPLQGNKKVLGPSINAVLGPVSTMLKLERSLHPERLGSAMFSVSDVYPRIKAFKASLPQHHPPLYFAKVDVKAAFDTIPQAAVLKLLQKLPSQSRYRMLKHVEVQPLETCDTKASRRWHTTARAAGDTTTFRAMLEAVSSTAAKKNTVFIDGAAQRVCDARELVSLTTTHIQQNLVRIGKKFYRQREGIPQGSVLSSALCNYFYADLERTRLAFLAETPAGEYTLLLRLIDDFLLMTTNRKKAEGFVRVMHSGLPEYGVSVNPNKSLVNFDLVVDGKAVPRVQGHAFPYCGLTVDTKTLEVGRHCERDTAVFNALTVEYGRSPGQTFKRKVLNAFKIQSSMVFFDTAHNSRQVMLGNAYRAFVETATKMWAYIRCLPRETRPGMKLLTDTVKTLIDVAYLLLTSKSRKARYPGYVCAVDKTELAWLAMVACRQVLVKRQSGYKEVIGWLEDETLKLVQRKGFNCRGLVRVVKGVS